MIGNTINTINININHVKRKVEPALPCGQYTYVRTYLKTQTCFKWSRSAEAQLIDADILFPTHPLVGCLKA